MKRIKILPAILLFFFLLFCLINISYAKTNHDIADEYYTKGLEYGISGNFKAAEAEFNKALEVYKCYNVGKRALKIIDDVKSNKIKKETAVDLFLGLELINNQEYDKAVEKFKQMISTDKKNSRAYTCLGLAYGLKDDYDNAVSEYKKAIALDPNDDFAYESLGVIYFHYKNMPDEAMSAFKSALKANPNADSSHAGLGEIYAEKNMFEDAVAEYKKAIELDPKEPDYYYDLGNAYFRAGVNYASEGDFAKAKINFHKSSEIASFYKPFVEEAEKIIEDTNKGIVKKECAIYLFKAQNYIQKGMPDEAAIEIKKAAEINPEYIIVRRRLAGACLVKAGIYAQKGMLNEAITETDNALKIYPESAEVHWSVAAFYLPKGRLDESIAECKKAIEINPDFPNAYYTLAEAYYLKKEYDLAIENCDKAVSLGYEARPKLLEALKPYRK